METLTAEEEFLIGLGIPKPTIDGTRLPNSDMNLYTIHAIMKLYKEHILNQQGQKELILWDKINNRESRFWYRDSSGNFYIDLDPHGVDMSGKRKISIAPKHQYEARYKQQS